MPASYRDHLGKKPGTITAGGQAILIEPTGRTNSSASNMWCPTSIIS